MLIQAIKAAREALKGSAPMERDCGRYCGKACCAPDEDGKGGMYLFPGEEALLGDFAKIESADMAGLPVKIATCDGNCERTKRPLACMIFPLTPYSRPDGQFGARLDCRSRAVCPLNRDGIRGLRAEFVTDVERAFAIIAAEPAGRAFLIAWQAQEDEFRAPFL